MEKMAYDKELDKNLYEKSVTIGESVLTVSVFQYNEGAKKLQLSRATAEDNKFTKLGRMTLEEVNAVLPLMQGAVEIMG